ncbi:10897_t:CDS:1, partial [Cetraspora pellucida]
KNNKNIVFDSIFTKTHNELEDLNNEINKLQNIYLTNENSDKGSDNKTNEYEACNKMPVSLTIYNNDFFITAQIEHFYKIYTLYLMHTVIEDKKACEK